MASVAATELYVTSANTSSFNASFKGLLNTLSSLFGARSLTSTGLSVYFLIVFTVSTVH
jgi:hypothetical protein